MWQVKIVQIGAGRVAAIRRQNYPENAKVVALVVRNVEKYAKIVKMDKTLGRNILITNNLKQVWEKFPNDLIWDIVADDETHLMYLKEILKIFPAAKIILGKTPYSKKLISKFTNAAKAYPEAKITITENYAVSVVTAKVAALIEKYQMKPKKIILEFTKNRVKDIENGRFLHCDIGVLGYEGSHMITILTRLGKKFDQIVQGKFEDLILSGGQVLKNQGSAKVVGKADSAEVVFYTAMNGKILNKLPELGITSNVGFGNETRHRVLIVEEGTKRIIGQYDPIPGLAERPYGSVWVFEDGKIVEKIDKIYDNTMRAILEQQICYLTNTCPNPMSLENAKNFVILEKIYNQFRN